MPSRRPVSYTHLDVYKRQGYEIHHGVCHVDPQVLASGSAETFLDGCRVGSVWGTLWHLSLIHI